MGNCLSAEVCASDDVSPATKIQGPAGELKQKRDFSKTKGTFSRDQSVLSPTRRRGAKIVPGNHGEVRWKERTNMCDEGTDHSIPTNLEARACSWHSSPIHSSADALISSCSSTSSTNSLFVEGSSLLEDFSLGHSLGSGRYGNVVACTRKCDGAKLACKVISNSHGARDASREVEVLSMVRGQPGIVQVESVYLHRKTLNSRGLGSWKKRPLRSPHAKVEANERAEEVKEVQIVMERCYGGTLADRLKEKGHFSEAEALRILRSVLGTVELLHSHGFIHRDLKDTNFLFSTTDPGSPVVAIDFGLAATFKQGEMLSEVAGSPLYIAPEVVKREYGPQCDVWSAGVLLHQMLCGVHPFQRDSVTAVLKAVTTTGVLDFESEPWPSVSDSTKNLLRSMLTRDPAIRPTPSQLLDILGRDGCVPWSRAPQNCERGDVHPQEEGELR